MSLRVAICIATHNRRDELIRTLGVLAGLDPAPDEVLVAADGCTDGTDEWVRENHPGVRLVIHPQPHGSIASRNELGAICQSDIFVSLDDDSYPIERDFIARVRKIFSGNPRLAVASFPQRTDEYPETLSQPDFGEPHFIGSYANSAAAIRRSTFRGIGGYPDFFSTPTRSRTSRCAASQPAGRCATKRRRPSAITSPRLSGTRCARISAMPGTSCGAC